MGLQAREEREHRRGSTLDALGEHELQGGPGALIHGAFDDAPEHWLQVGAGHDLGECMERRIAFSRVIDKLQEPGRPRGACCLGECVNIELGRELFDQGPVSQGGRPPDRAFTLLEGLRGDGASEGHRFGGKPEDSGALAEEVLDETGSVERRWQELHAVSVSVKRQEALFGDRAPGGDPLACRVGVPQSRRAPVPPGEPLAPPRRFVPSAGGGDGA